MKIAVSSMGPDLDSMVSPRFGRCPYFVVVETANMGYDAIPNNSANNFSGAGIAAAQEIANRGIDTVLTGRFGPNASIVLSQVGIEMVSGAGGKVKQAIEDYQNGKLSKASTPVNQSFGYGRGMGGGRGAGRGMGRGMGFPTSYNKIPTMPQRAEINQNNEKDALKQHLRELEDQLKEIKKRLEEIE